VGGPPRGPIIRSPLDAAVFARPSRIVLNPGQEPVRSTPPAAPAPPVEAPPAEPPVATPARIEPTRPATEALVAAMPQPRSSRPQVQPPIAVPDRTLPPPNVTGGFRLGQAPYVEGEFVAAMKIADGRWATVRPQPEGFLNSWQRRVLLWFGLSVALIAPLALFVAWRLAAPLKVFAESADRLGREPSADLPPLSGPAEIGKAADAFNLMQQRLKRYVEDRTGMIRAISHDLRTPLTRMRFKLERASPALRVAIGRDMDQMEEMIASVLSFMRDETQVARRQVVDLRSLLEVVVDDAPGPAKLEPGPPVLAEIDVVGVQRVVENLIDNALKYGERATVRLDVRDGEAWIEVADNGPGLAAEDLERVFQPFYRSVAARASGKAGVGLGLSVSRSTIRAHGGDLRLRPAPEGLVAELRLPEARPARTAAAA
jgi:signal transduction histidine kinase